MTSVGLQEERSNTPLLISSDAYLEEAEPVLPNEVRPHQGNEVCLQYWCAAVKSRHVCGLGCGTVLCLWKISDTENGWVNQVALSLS